MHSSDISVSVLGGCSEHSQQRRPFLMDAFIWLLSITAHPLRGCIYAYGRWKQVKGILCAEKYRGGHGWLPENATCLGVSGFNICLDTDPEQVFKQNKHANQEIQVCLLGYWLAEELPEDAKLQNEAEPLLSYPGTDVTTSSAPWNARRFCSCEQPWAVTFELKAVCVGAFFYTLLFIHYFNKTTTQWD